MRRITVLADEPRILKFLTLALQAEGFLVHSAAPCIQPECPEDCALSCCDGGNVPDLAIFEVILARTCCGIEAAHKALRRWPHVKILLTSASSRDSWPAGAAALFDTLPDESCAFLPKPFTMPMLRAAVNDLLNRHRGTMSECPFSVSR
jgi:DNA-binding response OmpR family regulator